MLRYMGFVRAHVAAGALRAVVETYVADARRRAQLLALLDGALAAHAASWLGCGGPSVRAESSWAAWGTCASRVRLCASIARGPTPVG